MLSTYMLKLTPVKSLIAATAVSIVFNSKDEETSRENQNHGHPVLLCWQNMKQQWNFFSHAKRIRDGIVNPFGLLV